MVHGRWQAVGEGAQGLLLGGAPLEPLVDQRLQAQAVRRRQAQRGRGAAEGGQQDEGARTGRPSRLPGCVTACEGGPPGVVPRGAGEEGPGHPEHDLVGRDAFAAAPQMSGGLQPVERGAQRALPVREPLGQGLHGDVGAVRQPVDVGGDGGFAGRQMAEVAALARALVRGGTLAVTGVRHGVRGLVRGAGGGTKLVDSHQIGFLWSISLVRPLSGVPAPAGVVCCSAR